MTKLTYTLMMGGLGDVLLTLFTGDVGYFKDLKTKRPDSRTRVILHTTNEHAQTLFDHDPTVDETELHHFKLSYIRRPGRSIAQNITEEYERRERDGKRLTKEDQADLSWERPTIHLTEHEKAQAEAIEAKGPFVAFHPFAGDQIRNLNGRIDVPRTLQRMLEAGHHIVLLGGSYTRRDRGHDTEFQEELTEEHPNLTNLVNKGSVRLQAHLTTKAKKFVGSCSAYHCAAEAHQIPSLCFTHPGQRLFYEKASHGVFWMAREHGSDFQYWDRMPADPTDHVLKFLER